MIFDKILDVTKIYMGPHDILVEVKRDQGRKVILPESKNGLSEEADEYGVIHITGDEVPEKFATGNVILGVSGKGYKSFENNKVKYIILPTHAIGVMVTPDNFKITAKVKKTKN